ncbi:MAG: DNA polymerase III subunit delta [Desulfobacula sp.]|uniref:DNA polymerase III subunit delta n=1 Tax=Desulfobacula sp. TaxID=2593537 RepID=UPI0025C3745A|nr:DNA polymerase III subunit delta [Desulfobacula sp.]MCD4719434.1 DNA polymerase III subunit delta [Desulfobacula sp.]
MAKNNVKYNQLNSFLKSVQKNDIPGLILIFGESYLLKHAFKTISSFLLGNDNNKQFALDTLEGGSVSMGDIIEQVSTFSFLVSKKIVAVKNAPLFQTQQGSQEISFSQSDFDHLIDFIEKGIPPNHSLIFTTNLIDKRKKIYKAIANKGLIIDCSVATGARKADLDEQRAVLQSLAGKILSNSKKKIDNQAFHALVDLTGFNLHLFSQNIEKLIAYCGKNELISIADVKTVIVRDKKDPIFNLTNAFMAKDVKNALFYLNSLFTEGFHPLQILKSFENQIRKLILVKCFTEQFYQNNTHISLKRISFNLFKQSVLPKIIDHDEQTKTDSQGQDEYLSKKSSKKKINKSNDLLLAPNPKNAYPVFQIFQKSENFSLNELSQSLIFLSDLDYRLKSSSFDAKTVIENFIINTCSKGGFVYAEKNKNRRHYF